MSYKVLARKWRPQHFRDMLGQEPVLRALVNALDSNRLHHAYLFTGMRGVGKTTIARIFAKCLNCETRGVSADPCGTCSACQDIDAGRFLDLIEVDAASRTKVEGTRELLENVPYAPASGRYKVYLIDEVHMFSTHSFNALLKTLEEPPEHVKFLLATTDPQKVPATVLSRCLQFNLKRMAPGILTDYLSKILNDEAIEHERPALDLIARASEGSVRDALSLVEQAAASGEGAVMATEVESMLGRASVDRLLALIETLAAGDMPSLFTQVDELAQYAPEFSELLGEILTLLHRIAMLRSVPGSVSESAPGHDRLSALANTLDPDVVQLFYQIGLHARRDMPYAPDTREAFDMALLRMQAFKPQQGVGALAGPGGGPVLSGSPAAQSGAAQPGAAQPGAAQSGAAQSGDQGQTGSSESSGTPADASVASASGGLAVRGSVSAGGLSMRDAALAAARGESLPDDVVQQLEQLNPQLNQSLPPSAQPEKTPTRQVGHGEPAVKPDKKPPSEAQGAAVIVPEAHAEPEAKAEPVTKTEPEAHAEPVANTEPVAHAELAANSESAVQADPELQSALKPDGQSPSEPPAQASPEVQEQAPQNSPEIQEQAPQDSQTEGIVSDQARPDAAAALDPSALTPDDWPRLVSELDIAGMPRQLANNCTWLGLNNDQIALQIEASSEHLQKDRFVERLQNALSQWFGRDVRIVFEQVMQPLNTPTKLAEAQAARDMAAARDSIKLDPIVLQLIDKVDGSVDEASIRPIGQSFGEP